MRLQAIEIKLDRLQHTAQSILDHEKPVAVQEVNRLIERFGLTAREIHLPSHLKGVKVSPKYINPSTGETWSGRGIQPRWVRHWLATGNPLDKLLIK